MNLFIAAVSLPAASKWYLLQPARPRLRPLIFIILRRCVLCGSNGARRRVSPFSFLLVHTYIRVFALCLVLCLFLAASQSLVDTHKRPPRHKRTCRPSRVKQSSVSGSLVPSNMIAPDRHRFCPVYRCEIGALRMPGNRCHHGPAKKRCNGSIRFLCFAPIRVDRRRRLQNTQGRKLAS